MSVLAALAVALPAVAGAAALLVRWRRAADLVTLATTLAAGLAVAVVVGADAAPDPVGPRVDLDVAALTLGVVGGRLEGVLLLVVTGIGAVVAAASARSLRGEPTAARFAGALGLTVAATGGVTVAASLPVLAVAWVAVTPGLYALLTHQRDVPGTGRAARRTARRLLVGDVAVVAGVVVAAVALDDLDVAALGAGAAGLSAGALALVLVPLAVGGFVRSAQVPAHGWLPLTVWAPSPVSALLHAGVVNAAGVLLVRLSPAVAQSPAVLHLAVVVGTVTTVLAAAATLVRSDVKGALVRSTIAQMGFMVLQVGLGAFAAAVFHVIAHGAYKAARFLGSGTGIHAARVARADPPDDHPPATPDRWLVAGVPAAAGVAVTVWWYGDKVGAVVLLSALAATALAAVAAAVRHLRGGEELLAAGAVVGVLAVAYGAAVDGLDAALDLPRPVDGPGAGVALAVVAVGALATWAVHERPGWLYRRLLTERLVERRPPELPAGPPADPAARTTLRSRVALATELVAPSWPLTAFVASNPLADLETSPFTEATATAGRLRPGRTHLPHDRYLELRAAGRIGDHHLVAAALDRLPGLDEHPPVDLGVERITTVELVRRALLLPPDPEPEPARPDVDRVGIDLTLGEWLDRATGSRILEHVDREVGRWAAALVDTTVATWTLPGREHGLWAAWRALDPLAEHLPERADDAVLAALAALHVPDDRVVGTLRRTLGQQPGWPAQLRWRAQTPAEPGMPRPPADLVDLLALRLTLEARAVATAAHRLGADPTPAALAEAVARRAPAAPPSGVDGAPTRPHPVRLAAAFFGLTTAVARDIWLGAHELAVREELLARIGPDAARVRRPAAQAAFCIDVRSEVLRRHLEAVGDHETFGIGGFFGAAVRHHPLGGRGATDQCPVLVRPRAVVDERPVAGAGEAAVAGRRRLAALGHVVHDTKADVTTPFAFVEIVGWAALVELVARTAVPTGFARWRRWATERIARPVRTELHVDVHGDHGLDLDQQTLFAEAALRLIGLHSDHARLVLWCGHGSTTENNPYESALDCGACGGNPGGVNARLLADLCNRPPVRARLAERGIAIPDDTWFLAGQHDTTTEVVTVFDADRVPATHRADLEQLLADLDEAGRRAAVERCRSLPGSPARARAGDGSAARAHLLHRATDWAQIRPEWGLAGCVGFVAGPRSLTRRADLGGRVFLHSYESDLDPDGSVLETIFTAPLVVAEWISTQYYFSTVDDLAYGAGPKLVHNLVGGGAGVLLGPEGDLRVGLPRESVAAGDGAVHEPVRLLAVAQAPHERIDAIVERNPILQRLIGHAWIAVVAREGAGEPWYRLDPDLIWRRWGAVPPDLAVPPTPTPASPSSPVGR